MGPSSPRRARLAPQEAAYRRIVPFRPADVKTIVSATAPTSAPTSARAPSIAARAARPAACTLDGFPGSPRSAAAIASATSARTGVVAL